MTLRSTFIILRRKDTTKCLCRTPLTLTAHYTKALALTVTHICHVLSSFVHCSLPISRLTFY